MSNSKMAAEFMRQLGHGDGDKQSVTSKRKPPMVSSQKGGLASVAIPARRSGTKPGGNVQDQVQTLPESESGPHLKIITSDDVHVLRATGTAMIKVL